MRGWTDSFFFSRQCVETFADTSGLTAYAGWDGAASSPSVPFATIVLGSPEWIAPAAALAALALLFVFRGYWQYFQTGRSALLIAGVAKATACLLCAALLIEPLWSSTRPKPGANQFILLADNSQSMQIRDPDQRASRGERLKAALTDDQAPWQTRLQQDFQIRRYMFDQRTRRTDDFLDLTFDGAGTAIKGTLESLAQRFQNRPIAGVLLFTDGVAADWDEELSGTEAMPPIYPVVVGSENPLPDLRIVRSSVQQSGFEDAPVSIDAEVEADGHKGKTVVAQLCKLDGETVAEHKHEVISDSQTLKFLFRTRQEAAGIHFYRIRVFEEGKEATLDGGKQTFEASVANNQRLLAVDRGQGPYRILYVAGRPNWEFKFLRRALETDTQLDLVALIRIAKREAKFDFRGRAGESSNSLFRGFGDEVSEETERYDEPVLTRLNTRDAEELRDGFPKTAELLYDYHAVILDDVDSDFFTYDQLKLLHDFVSERGGSLLMLGGQETFRNGKYERTPVGDVLPVYVDRMTQSSGAATQRSGLRLTLTREGWLQPWVRLRDTEAEERKRLEELPGFRTVNVIRGIKPGASVLASVEDSSGEKHPALIVHRFGRGRSAALTIGDLWRWGIREDPQIGEFAKAWRQIARWLVAEVPQRIEIDVQHDGDASGSKVRLATTVLNEEYLPMVNADVELSIVEAENDAVTLQTSPSTQAAGEYQADFVARRQGAYTVEATVVDADSKTPIGQRQSGWVSDPAAEEFRRLSPNRDLMQKLADTTGGELLSLDDLDSFVKGLPSRPVPVTEQWASPLWHRPYFLLAIVACLAFEWGVRRYNGLA